MPKGAESTTIHGKCFSDGGPTNTVLIATPTNQRIAKHMEKGRNYIAVRRY